MNDKKGELVTLRFHHVGVLVDDVATHSALYVKRLGYQVRSEVIRDPVQSAFVQFLSLPGEKVYLEFIAPDGPGSHLTNALKKGGGLNHICYSCAEIELTCAELRDQGLLLIHRPAPAVAFNGRKIAWMMGKDRLLIELVECGPENEL
jgi:methylmalonyl-CoA/ethylmalonyl-CoA epimerase